MKIAEDWVQSIKSFTQKWDDPIMLKSDELVQIIRNVQIDAYDGRLIEMKDAAEMLWIVTANVSQGDWSKQNKDWQEAAAKYRDNFHDLCSKLNLKTA